jgi:hypothetical protein
MKVRQISQSLNSDQLILVIDGGETPSDLSDIRNNLMGFFSALVSEELVGVDQIYIDLKIEENLVILAWDTMAGISIECENLELRDKIFQYLQKL